MRKLSFLALALIFTGCNPDETDVPTPEDFDPYSDIGFDDDCVGHEDSDGVFHEIPGATRYFRGSYAFVGDGSDVEGYEYAVLFANDKWQNVDDNLDGDRCLYVWSVFGSVDESKGEMYTITLNGAIDHTQTDCPAGIFDDGEGFPVTYTIDESSTGAVRVMFESGSLAGEGSIDKDVMVWTSESACMWF